MNSSPNVIQKSSEKTCSEPNANKKERKVLSLAEKLSIINECDKNVGAKQCDLAKSFGIPTSSLRTILSKRKAIEDASEEFESKRKKIRCGKHDELEKILLDWFTQARAMNIPIDGPLLKSKGLEIAKKLGIDNFNASDGWLHRFRSRHGVLHKKISGEAESVDDDCVTSWMKNVLPSLLAGYAPADVFNADECALFYKLMPDKSMVYKHENCHGGKLSKDRLTVLLCTNADGTEKLPPLVIGKSKNPLCFKNVKTLPCDYEAQKSAWMSTSLFTSWLKSLDQTMMKKSRRILLLIDNCPVHPKDVVLKNIELKFFPANATSRLQPLDQGVIKVTKQKYRRRVVERYLAEIDSIASQDEVKVSLNVLDALHYISGAWNDVSAAAIQHCFQKAGFFPSKAVPSEEGDFQVWLDSMQPLLNCALKDFIEIDDDVVTCAEYSIDDIIAAKTTDNQNENVEDNSDDEESVTDDKAPLKIESLNAIQVLRNYFCSIDGLPQTVFDHLNATENAIYRYSRVQTQSSLSDFFPSK
ncbi:tigger transposable element-derived protein 6-like [Planococcus citri]|uniref:tigger transposable element-derived protein 6-like n=1 Tax=Planococcus citri TaxID=170843 RepID=UPI0031F95306